MIGGADEHVWHWLTNSADLARPRSILSDQRVRTARRAAMDLAAYDHTHVEHRRAVREIITHALAHAGATS